MPPKSFSAGFTFTELLIAVALLGILSVLGFTSWQGQLAKARDASRKASLKQLELALDSYRDDTGCYPPEEQIYCDSEFLAPDVPLIPCDPANNSVYHFRYVNSQCNEYSIYARLEDESDAVIAKLGCTDGCGPDNAYNYFVSSNP